MMSRQQQRWAILSLLHGRERALDPRQFDDPTLRGCYDVIRNLPAGQRQEELAAHLTTCYANGQEIMNSLLAAAPPNGGTYVSFAKLGASLAPIDWFWPGWIPCSMLSALAAQPGTGKSMVALDLARRLIAGEPGPDGRPLCARSRRVVYVDAENVPQIALQRARQWGIDLAYLYPLLPPQYGLLDLADLDHRDRLIEMIHAVRPGLIVIDSLSMISTKGDNNVEDVRPILAFLTALVREAACALLVIHHMRKRSAYISPGGPIDLNDVRGSGHIAAACRCILGLSAVQQGGQIDRNGPRRLEMLKTNLGAYPDPLGVDLVSGAEGEVRVRYGAAPPSCAPPTLTEQCAAWLLEALRAAGGPLKPSDLLEIARHKGFGRSTVFRARRELGNQIADTAGHKSPDNMWQLAPSP